MYTSRKKLSRLQLILTFNIFDIFFALCHARFCAWTEIWNMPNKHWKLLYNFTTMGCQCGKSNTVEALAQTWTQWLTYDELARWFCPQLTQKLQSKPILRIFSKNIFGVHVFYFCGLGAAFAVVLPPSPPVGTFFGIMTADLLMISLVCMLTYADLDFTLACKALSMFPQTFFFEDSFRSVKNTMLMECNDQTWS